MADIKEKNYGALGAGVGAARRGVVWFGLVWFVFVFVFGFFLSFFQVTLHNSLGEFPRKYRPLFLLLPRATLFVLLRAEVPALLGPPTRCRYTPPS